MQLSIIKTTLHGVRNRGNAAKENTNLQAAGAAMNLEDRAGSKPKQSRTKKPQQSTGRHTTSSSSMLVQLEFKAKNEQEQKQILEEMMPQSFPNLRKTTHLQV